MATITRTTTAKQGQLPAVTGTCRWRGAIPTLTTLDLGAAWLQATTARGVETHYWVARVTNVEGRLEGFRLTRFDIENGQDTGELYDLDCSFDRTDSRCWSCSCPDHTFRAHRREAGSHMCKHIKALAAGLKKLGLL